jgi:hypothetical protein
MYPPPTLPPLAVEEADALLRNVPEPVLQEVWRARRYSAAGLTTTTSAGVEVIDPGRLNGDAGPDFTDARLRLTEPDGQTVLLAGDVEVHRTSGEWLYHRHDADARYDRVVLHVVFGADRHTGRLRRSDGTPLPELVLDRHLDQSLRRLIFRFFAEPAAHFPCAARWAEVPDGVRRPWLRRLGRRRLLEKARRLAPAGRTEDALHLGALRALGYVPNADAMEELARRVPASVLHALPDLLDREALLLHMAGLLPDPRGLRHTDPTAAVYVADVAVRGERLARQLPAGPLSATRWTFFRLRPANFPPRRIAQAAALTGPGALLGPGGLGRLRAALEGASPLSPLRQALAGPSPSAFWQGHVLFDRPSSPLTGHLGRERADRLIADALLPALLLDALIRRDRRLVHRVYEAADAMPATPDGVTRRYAGGGFKPADEVEAQGLRALAHDWCGHGRCLTCAVGRHLLREAV